MFEWRLLILFGCFFNLILLAAGLLRKNKGFSDWQQIVFYACVAVFQLSNANITSDFGYYSHLPVMIEIPALGFAGPALYGFTTFALSGRQPRRKYLHLILPAALTLAAVPFYFSPVPEKLRVGSDVFYGQGWHYVIYIFAAAFSSSFLYSIFSFYKIWQVTNSKGTPFQLLYLITAAACLCFGLSTVSFIVPDFTYVRLAVVILTFATVGIFLLHQRYPEMLSLPGRFDQPNQAGRLKQTPARPAPDSESFDEEQPRGGRGYVQRALDFATIRSSLEELMLSQRLYRNENLKLGDLAKELGIPKHHLSIYLNEYERQSFRNFINGYRINEAVALVESSQLPITQIALRVGFNTISLFNRYFKDKTGLTPSAYRRTVKKQ